MSTAWINAFLGRIEARDVHMREESAPGLAPARLFVVTADDWGTLAHEAKNWECRWVAAWGEDTGEDILINAAFEKNGSYFVARTQVRRATPILPSHTPYYPGADRPERHIQDMLGVAFTDHPDARRWTRHQAWKDSEYPLRKNFPTAGNPPRPAPPDDSYRFLYAQGAGVYEIPVGPVHAGIIEPGHFRFQAVGETVLNLEEHLGYVHKGIEKIAEGATPRASPASPGASRATPPWPIPGRRAWPWSRPPASGFRHARFTCALSCASASAWRIIWAISAQS